MEHASIEILDGAMGFTINLCGFDQLFEPAPTAVFDAFLRAVEALKHVFVAFGAEFLTLIDCVFDDFGHVVYPIRHLVADVSLKVIETVQLAG